MRDRLAETKDALKAQDKPRLSDAAPDQRRPEGARHRRREAAIPDQEMPHCCRR